MSFRESIRYLEAFINYEKIPAYPYRESLKLERIRDFLSLIGNPQAGLRCIHVAGTKGKGSTCAFLTYILREAGFKAGLYTSPHLSDFRERIRILRPRPSSFVSRPSAVFEGMISRKALADLVRELKPAIESYNKKSVYGPLSFFEAYTALAFTYFRRQMCDFVVLETGLGGRLDATNVVNPLVAVITPISYEHTDKLGNTLRKIAGEKTGIIKVGVQGTPRLRSGQTGDRGQLVVIAAPQEREARDAIRAKCKDVGARLYEVGRNIFYEKTRTPNPEPRIPKFNIIGIKGEYSDLKIKLIGLHQWVNAAAAVGAIEALRFQGIEVEAAAIRKGLQYTLWPGRCEVVGKNPLVVLDGAQNVASARVLKHAIKENFRYRRLILILGISSDKDIKGICAELKDLADELILTKAKSPRATPAEKLAGYFSDKELFVTNSVRQAKQKAQALAKKADLILVTGSLFVVGEARKLLLG